jgi:vacuolar-type H+-ATPase subunit D/Vma8
LAGYVNYRTLTTQDVSKEFVDLESRLKTKREVEQRYSEILRKKAGTITELLEAEQKIGELHEEIEATVSRVNYLKDQVSYSTVNLEFYQTITQQIAESETNTTGKEFKEALTAGWNGVVNVLLVLTYAWPLLALGLTTGLFYWFKKRRSVAHA